MNILYIDIDSLRPDHLGCYGYHRQTSPNIDAIAAEGLAFSNCYVPDAPCLPSRTALTTGRFGIHTGVVNHGGVASQPHVWGPDRQFKCNLTDNNWANRFRENGFHTVAFSPFAQRHGAWHWYAGFMEMHNTGGNGQETADAISPQVCGWLDRHEKSDTPFFMWVNFWDPHTPYRTPLEEANPFADDPLPEWYTESVRQAHWKRPGPHSAQEVNGYVQWPDYMDNIAADGTAAGERQPLEISDMTQARRMFDGYDTGVRFADYHLGLIIDSLKRNGLYENTAIIISSDHGENLGELWVYGDHQTADHITCRVPMIVRWPGVTDPRAGETDDRLLYTLDIAATSLEQCGMETPDNWDGKPLAKGFAAEASGTPHRDQLVLSQMAWCAQRSVRWDHYLMIRSYHDAQHDYPDYMLFNVAEDPHEQHDLAEARPDLVAEGKKRLENWHQEMMDTATHPVDPLDTVLSEGGPYHSLRFRDEFDAYIDRLRETGRSEAAERLLAKDYPLTQPSQNQEV